MAAELREEIAEPNTDLATKRFLLDRLKVRLELRADDTGRWLEATCRVTTDPERLAIGLPGRISQVNEADVCRQIVFAAVLPLDHRKPRRPALADSLFTAAGVPVGGD